MVRLLVVLGFFTLHFASFAQQRCDCDLVDTFIYQRDFQEVIAYTPHDFQKDSRDFLKSKTRICQAFGYHLKALANLQSGKYANVKWLLDKERYILDSSRCAKKYIINNELIYGEYFLRIGQFETAIHHFSTALKLVRKADNKQIQVQALLSLSTAYSKLKQEDKSKYYLLQAHPLVAILPNGDRKVDHLFNLSARYYYHFEASKDAALLDSAQHAATFGMTLARTIGYEHAFIKGYNLLEDKQYHDRNYRQALVFLDSALYFTTPEEHAYERFGIFSDMADIYLELDQHEKAYKCADSSWAIALRLGNPYQLKNALELLYNCSKLSGEYERALTVYEDLVVMRDSISRMQASKEYDDLEEKYHRVRKEKSETEYEQDRALLEQQREIGNLRSKLITVGLIISLLLGCYIFIVFRQKKMSSRQKELEIAQRLQRARINPDFMYKALSELQLVASRDANKDVSKQIGSFAKLIKQTLDSSHDDFLTLDKEIEFLKFYMDLQRDRLENKFRYEFTIDDRLDQSEVCIPTLILQPFIENTIERGFQGIDSEGLITIQFELKNSNELFIKLQDNGKGLKFGDSERASEIINDRLYLLNKINKSSSSYLIRERSSGGVSIELYLPLINKDLSEIRGV